MVDPRHPIAYKGSLTDRNWPAQIVADLGDDLLVRVYKPGLSPTGRPFMSLRFNEATGVSRSSSVGGHIMNVAKELLPPSIDPDTGLPWKGPAPATPAPPPTAPAPVARTNIRAILIDFEADGSIAGVQYTTQEGGKWQRA